MILAGVQQLLTEYGWDLSVSIGNRIYPVALPEAPTLPAITYQVVGGVSSPGLTTSGPQKLRVQFDCYGETYKDATCAREQLRQLLNGFRGQLPDGSWLENGQLIQSIDFFESDARQYRCAIEFYLFFNFQD